MGKALDFLLPWESQPQGVVEVSDNTAAALNFAHWPKDIGGGSLASPSGTLNPGLSGIGVLNPRGTLSVQALGENYTLIVVAVGGTAASNQNWLGNDTGAGRVWQFRMGTGSQVELIRFNTTPTAFTAQSGALDLTLPYVAIGTAAGAAVASYGGNLGRAPATPGSATITGTIRQHTAAFPIFVGSRDGSLNAFSGTMHAYVVLPYAINAARAAEIIANPWQLFEPRRIWVPVSSGGVPTPVTTTTTLSAAIQAARSATASVAAAIQAQRTSSADITAAIQIARTAQASVNSAIEAARSATAAADAAIQAAQGASAVVNAYIQAGTSASASVNAAIQVDRTGSASLDSAIQVARSATASLAAAVQASASATASLNAYIQAGTSVSASVDAAIRAAQAASASVTAAIALASSASASLGAAIAVRYSVGAAMSAAVQASQAAAASVSAYVYDSSTVVLGSLAGSIRRPGATRTNVQTAARSNRQTARR